MYEKEMLLWSKLMFATDCMTFSTGQCQSGPAKCKWLHRQIRIDVTQLVGLAMWTDHY